MATLYQLTTLAQTGKIDSLRTIVQNYEGLVTNYKRDTIYIRHLIDLGKSFGFVKLDSMLTYANISRKLSKEINYKYGMLASDNNIGNYYMLKGDYEKAKSTHFKNLNASKRIKAYTLVSDTYNSIAYIYLRNSNYPKAYEICLQALDFAVEHNDYENVIKLNTNIGVLFSLLKDFKNSLRYFNECTEYQDKYNLKSNVGMVQANMGYSYLYLNEYEKGLKHLNQALAIFEKSQIPHWKAFTYVTIGRIFLQQKKLDKALEFFTLAEIEHLKIEDKKGTVDMKIGLANTYYLMNRFDLSEEYALKAETLATEHKYLEGLLGSSEISYKINKDRNNWKKSLVFLEKTRKIADSIAFGENKNILLMNEAKINYEREKENIENLSNRTISKQRQYVIWVSLGLFITICVAILIFKSNRKEQLLNKKLEQKTEILLSSQIKLHETNKNQEKLFSIIGHDLRGPIVSLKELLGLSLDTVGGEEYFYRFAPKLKKDLDHIHFTLDNLLHWGRTQMEGAKLYPESIPIKDEIDSIKDLFRKNIKMKSLSFENELASDMKVFVDFNHFSVIFRNLISNAIKFTPENGVITVSADRSLDVLIVKVKDNGLGMSDEIVTKIFNESEHYSTYGTNKEKGTGLGLSLCKEMVEKNGGSISVKSSEGNGSTFSISFPTTES